MRTDHDNALKPVDQILDLALYFSDARRLRGQIKDLAYRAEAPLIDELT